MPEREGLKPLEELLDPDIRNSFFVRTDPETGEVLPRTLGDHYADIERYALHEDVPEAIATQYDVARNLFLFAWFEYRFFNVAEANALVVLELAMKERLGKDEIERYIKQRNKEHKAKTGKNGGIRKGMKSLMECCRDHQLVKNEGFTRWQQHATMQAYHQAQYERNLWAIGEMNRTGVTEITLPDIELRIMPPDPDYDHIQHLINNVSKFRNIYAHGSTMLHNQVHGTFEMVSEFISQLYGQPTRT
ncbi:MAG: hypothetical protein CL583_18935 [Alteromonadaceae bacterium]|nr:hypothetical protein [Alteromonadaceae bacterium]|tara:strand:- start:1997 stop:2737 length:741 start_codon:yes stop_codon:yes gene_type:complete